MASRFQLSQSGPPRGLLNWFSSLHVFCFMVHIYSTLQLDVIFQSTDTTFGGTTLCKYGNMMKHDETFWVSWGKSALFGQSGAPISARWGPYSNGDILIHLLSSLGLHPEV